MGMMNETKAAGNKKENPMSAPKPNPTPYPTVEPSDAFPDQIRARHLATVCEICEEQLATTTAVFVDARLCQDCADTEPGVESCDSCGFEWGMHDYRSDEVICPLGGESEDVR